MIYEVIGRDIFPGNFLDSAAVAYGNGEGPVALIVNSSLADDAVGVELDRYRQDNIAGVVVVGGQDAAECEPTVERFCRDGGIPLVVLRCAPVVGTGMDGRWRDMVNAIYRGIYALVEGNQARASLIHALDVAEIAVRSAGQSGLYYICDGFSPKVNDIAGAFASRLSGKRLPVLSPGKARVMSALLDLFTLGRAGARRRLGLDMADSVMSPTPLYSEIGFSPRNTVDYLSNHTYSYDDI